MPRLLLISFVTWLTQGSAGVVKTSLRSPNSRSRSRALSMEAIAGYVPLNLVTDHNAIDLDQKYLEKYLSEGETGFPKAKALYEKGGHSLSIATVTLANRLTEDFPQKTKFKAKRADGDDISLTLYKTAERGTNVLHLQYDTIEIQEYYQQCRVGGLQESDRVTNGCMISTGFVTGPNNVEYEYNYDVGTGNTNERSLRSISAEAEFTMLACYKYCPYKDAKMFAKYYGYPDYGDQWIMAAFNGVDIAFSNGEAKFKEMGTIGRAECIKKGTAYINVFMYVLREFESALGYCDRKEIDKAVRKWDKGVAYYTGSEEKQYGEGTGFLLHELANKRCKNFGTCGRDKETAEVNYKFLELVRQGQAQIDNEQCIEARRTKEAIADIMYIPLIQGTLRYAYKMSTGTAGEKGEAEGAVFAAAVLPRVHAANQNRNSAQVIYDNMHFGATSTDFVAVKEAFESEYVNMNIKCNQVGGILNDAGTNYLNNASPCNDGSTDDTVGKGGDDGADDGTDDKNGGDDGADDGTDDKNGGDDGADDGTDDKGSDDTDKKEVTLIAVIGSVSGVLVLGAIGAAIFLKGRKLPKAVEGPEPVFEAKDNATID